LPRCPQAEKKIDNMTRTVPTSRGKLSILFRTGTGKETGFRVVAQAIEPSGELGESHKMKTRCFDHIDLRVKDMEVAKKFYGKILPQLGFVHEKPGRYFHTFYSAAGDRPSEFFCLSPDKNHKPNRTRIAFWANTREEVDRVAKVVREAGGKRLEGPEVCKGYSPGYYAFFFEDPDGNKLEICCRERPIIAK
jgi:catechol 2,3-dioxygenase-like lactoylglutathione lyase family enzyme